MVNTPAEGLVAVSIPGLNVDSFIHLIQDPFDTQEVFNIARTLVGAENYERLSKPYRIAIEADAGLKLLFNDRYSPPVPTPAELLKFPETSLGRGLGKYLHDNNISLDFEGFDLSKIYDEQEKFHGYVRLRSRRLHDVLHVVLDCDTSPTGEAQVAAFQSAQYGGAYQALIVSFMTTHISFFEPENLPTCLKLTNCSFEAGLRADPFYGIPWESHFGESLESLRERFTISNT